MAKFVFLLFWTDAKHLEHLRLQVAFVDTNGATAEFDPVEDDIVGDRPDFGVVAGFEQRHVPGVRAGEGVMHGNPRILLMHEGEERKIDHPKEVEGIAAFGEFEQLAAAQPHATEDFANVVPFVRAEKEHVPLGEAHAFGERGFLSVAEKLHDG